MMSQDDSNQKYRGKKRRVILSPLRILSSCCDGPRQSTSPIARQRPCVCGPVGKTILVVAIVITVQRLLSLYMGSRRFIPAPIANIYRECPKIDSYETISKQQETTAIEEQEQTMICLTTLTDHASTSTLQRFIRWRNFDSILNLTLSNKRSYVNAHPKNYRLYDGSHLIDPSRPPAWTKVKAVQVLLEESCDWIVWMDADTVIMNPKIAWEDILPSKSSTQSLLIGSDKGGGYNSGVFAFRNNDWTREFLQRWWNMTDFVRPPGLALSGDNASLKHYLAQLHKIGEFDTHVAVPARCHLNSFAKLIPPQQYNYINEHLEDYRDDWYMSPDYYHKGDFIAHFPGIDNKEEALKLFLDLAVPATPATA